MVSVVRTGMQSVDPARAGVIRADDPEPLLVQAAEFIKREIAAGALQPGARLPPERLLCEQLTISRVTLRRALGQLVDEGILSPSHGRGWYVASDAATVGAAEWPNTLESFTETATRLGLTPASRVLAAGCRPASIDEAETLVIAPGTQLFVMDRLRLLNGVPTAVDRTRVPDSYLPDRDGVDFAVESFYDVAHRAGLDIATADSTIEATEATEELAGALAIDPGKALLVMNQTAFDRRDRPLFLTTLWYVGERYRLRTIFARPPGARRVPR